MAYLWFFHSLRFRPSVCCFWWGYVNWLVTFTIFNQYYVKHFFKGKKSQNSPFTGNGMAPWPPVTRVEEPELTSGVDIGGGDIMASLIDFLREILANACSSLHWNARWWLIVNLSQFFFALECSLMIDSETFPLIVLLHSLYQENKDSSCVQHLVWHSLIDQHYLPDATPHHSVWQHPISRMVWHFLQKGVLNLTDSFTLFPYTHARVALW